MRDKLGRSGVGKVKVREGEEEGEEEGEGEGKKEGKEEGKDGGIESCTCATVIDLVFFRVILSQ